MKQFEKSKEQRKEKIQERAELEKRKTVKNKRYHVIENDDEIEELLSEMENNRYE
jgi:hypothetical protein